ncbi:MAG: hypothetical protein P4L03_02810 [Terracidiphilus sp.]|nr:hypothetical protein [Terracidiphilus sp.]
MTIQVELTPETEARLTAAAQARGVALEQYAGTLLHEVLAAPPAGSGKLSVDELNTMLSEIAEGSDRLPHVPTSVFTRESFYEGRL